MLKQYLPLCWFGDIPATLTTSKRFLWKNLMLYLCAGLFIQANITDLVEAFIQIIIELFITIIFITVLLKIHNSFSQFYSVFTAFLICENFFYLSALPIAIWYIAVRGSEYSILPIYAAMVLIVWFCAIISYLLRKLFAYPVSLSILLAIFYFVITYLGSLALSLM